MDKKPLNPPAYNQQDLEAGPSQPPHIIVQPSGPSYNRNMYPAYNDPFTLDAAYQASQRAKSRFFTALFYGVAIWITLGIVFGSLGYDEMESGKHHKHHHSVSIQQKQAIQALTGGLRTHPVQQPGLFDAEPLPDLELLLD